MTTIETKTVANVNEIVDIINKLNYKGETFEYENTSTFDDNSKGRFFGSVRKNGNPGGFSILEILVDDELKAVRFFNHYKDITVEFKLGDFTPSYDRFDNVIEIPAEVITDNLKEETTMTAEVATGYIFTVYCNDIRRVEARDTKCAILGDDNHFDNSVFREVTFYNKDNLGWELKTASGDIIIKGNDAPDFAKILAAVDQPANVTAAETDGSEDDPDEDNLDTPDNPDNNPPDDIMKKYKDVCWIIKHRIAKNGRHMWFAHTGIIGKAEAAERLNKWGLTIEQYLAAEEHDGLNDVDDVAPVIQPLRQTFIVKPDGNEYCEIFTDNDVVTYLNGEFKDVFSTKYAACYFGEHYNLRYRWYTPDKYGVICANEEHTDNADEFFAEMERRGACSFDPPEDKTALADSLTRAMTIALVNYQNFCRAKNLTAAANEMKLYNICRKALSELWRSEAA